MNRACYNLIMRGFIAHIMQGGRRLLRAGGLPFAAAVGYFATTVRYLRVAVGYLAAIVRYLLAGVGYYPARIGHQIARGLPFAAAVGCSRVAVGYLRAARLLVLSTMVVMLAMPSAALDLQLTSGEWRPINIVVEDFGNDDGVAQIVRFDLRASGHFRTTRAEAGRYGAVSDDYLGYVRGQGGVYLLTGEIVDEGDKFRLYFELHDTLTERSLGRFSLGFAEPLRRQAAHQVSNWIYESVLRKVGVFHSKVVYVVREKDGTNLLRVADYDGYNAQTVLSSPEPIISPTWSPDGNELLYVSFERHKPVVYRQSLLNGERWVEANFPGSNSAPAVSPDGRKLAVVLTENKHLQQIYIISGGKGGGGAEGAEGAGTKQRMRQGRRRTVDTEPSWSADGQRLVFVSDEIGTPQIYEYRLDSGAVRRLSYGSSYCVSPSYSQDGQSVLHVRRDAGRRNNVAIMDVQGGEATFLSQSREADSPSFSPNDAMVLYKDENSPNFLRIVAVNGIIRSSWGTRESGEIVNPVWGPSRSGWY